MLSTRKTMSENNNIYTMSNSDSRYIVEDYLSFRLHKAGYNLRPVDQNPCRVRQCMRLLGTEFEERYNNVFQSMCDQLHITDQTAYPAFIQIANELFSDGIKWGRVVGLFSFGGALAVYSVEKELPHLVNHIVDWVTLYVNSILTSWIIQNGGWNGFIQFYDGGPDNRNEPLWSNVSKLCGIAMGAGIVIGALMFSKS